MKNTKSVVIKRLSDDSLNSVSGGFITVAGEVITTWLAAAYLLQQAYNYINDKLRGFYYAK